MRSFVVTFVAALFYAVGVRGHGYVNNATIGGVEYSGYLPYSDPYYNPVPERIFREIPGNGPVEDFTLIDLQCNGYQGAGSAPAPLSAPVAAGSTIELVWTTWPDSHKGPVITYMAACPGNCTDYMPGDDAVWFKIQEDGKHSDGTWASDAFVTNEPYELKLPASLKAGNYIVRHEIIALHSAYTYPGAQDYPSCFQITLTGGGSSTGPSSKVSFPGEYTADTPGIIYDIYTTSASDPYPIPGPDVWNE